MLCYFYTFQLNIDRTTAVPSLVCVYVCLSGCMVLCISVCVCLCVCVCRYGSLQRCVRVCVSVCLSGCMVLCKGVCVSVCLCVCLSAWFSVDVCACLWVLKCMFYARLITASLSYRGDMVYLGYCRKNKPA